MTQTLQLFLLVLLFSSCDSQRINDDVYNETYTVGQIPELKNFKTYNEYDKEMEKSGNDLVVKGGFKNNRSRIFLESTSNNKQASQDSAFHVGMPTPCYCGFDKDTLKVKVGIGFFGGMGFETKIFKSKFLSNYFFYTDDVKPYKSDLAGEFTDNLYLQNKLQSLVLNELPTFKLGQQLTGYLTFTSPNWYEKSLGDHIDTNSVKGRLYFTCLTQ